MLLLFFAIKLLYITQNSTSYYNTFQINHLPNMVQYLSGTFPRIQYLLQTVARPQDNKQWHQTTKESVSWTQLQVLMKTTSCVRNLISPWKIRRLSTTPATVPIRQGTNYPGNHNTPLSNIPFHLDLTVHKQWYLWAGPNLLNTDSKFLKGSMTKIVTATVFRISAT